MVNLYKKERFKSEKEKLMNKKILAIILIVAAVVAIVLGVVTMTKAEKLYTGRYVSHETYGGDAYTGIQNAAADTAGNVQSGNYILREIDENLCFGLGSILIVIGLTLAAFAVAFLLGKKDEPAPVKSASVATSGTFMPKNVDFKDVE